MIMKKGILVMMVMVVVIQLSAQNRFDVTEYKVDTDNYPAYDVSAIEKAIKELVGIPNFEYRYINSGCNNKSHLIALYLQKKLNIKTFKVWLFAKNTIYHNGYGVQLRVKDPNSFTQNGYIYWEYHVAVAVKVKSGNSSKIMVIDLPLNEKEPVNLTDWLLAASQTNSYYTFTEAKYNDYETIVPAYIKGGHLEQLSKSGNIFGGIFYTDKLSVDSGWIANDLARDKAVMEYYNEVLKPQIDNNSIISQANQMIQQAQPQIRQQGLALGKTEQQIQLEIDAFIADKYKLIQAERYKITQPISDISNISLPQKYEDRRAALKIELQKYILNIYQ